MTELLDLHISNLYYIKAQKLAELNAVQLTYPASVIYNDKVEEDIYIYHSVTDYMIVYKDSVNNEPLCQLKAPNYIHRILLLEDVFLKCLLKNLDTELMVCIDEKDERVKGEQPLLKLMSEPLTEEEKEKEKNLSALFYELVLEQDGLEKAEKFNIVDGYRIVSNILNNRGICK